MNPINIDNHETKKTYWFLTPTFLAMALQRYSASSSSSSGSDYGSCSGQEDDGTDDSGTESSHGPPRKKALAEIDTIRSLSWNQLQSLELDDGNFNTFYCKVFLFHNIFWFSLIYHSSTALGGLAFQGNDTSYQAHGKSPDRIRIALKKDCCQRKCKRGVSFQLALRVCVAFWSLTKAAQDSMLHGCLSTGLMVFFWGYPFLFIYTFWGGYLPNRLWSLQNPAIVENQSDDPEESGRSDTGSSQGSESGSSSERGTPASWFIQGILISKFIVFDV